MVNEIKQYRCRGYLFCMYELLEKSTPKIAKECGVVQSIIYKWLRKFNIRTRTNSEAQTGEKNPMYGKMSGKDNPMYGTDKTGEKNPMYGKHWSEESKDKMRGKNNPNWKEDGNISVNAIHKRIAKTKPKPSDGKCKICHKVKDKYGKTKLVLSNLKDHHYTLNPDEYQWIHESCHRKYDAKKGKTKREKQGGRENAN